MKGICNECDVYVIKSKLKDLRSSYADFLNILEILTKLGVNQYNFCTLHDMEILFSDLLCTYNFCVRDDTIKIVRKEISLLDNFNDHHTIIISDSGVHFIYGKSSVSRAVMKEYEAYERKVKRNGPPKVLRDEGLMDILVQEIRNIKR